MIVHAEAIPDPIRDGQGYKVSIILDFEEGTLQWRMVQANRGIQPAFRSHYRGEISFSIKDAPFADPHTIIMHSTAVQSLGIGSADEAQQWVDERLRTFFGLD